ncbi:hypothetical protein T484DRAFT_1766133, partial [Baffinella frigidus]
MGFSISSVTLFGVVANWSAERGFGGNVVHGAWFAWVGNGYAAEYFLVAVGASALFLALSAAATLAGVGRRDSSGGWGAGKGDASFDMPPLLQG